MTSIPETMRALVLFGPEQIEVREVPVPQPGPGEVLLRVRACTVCNATDLKIFRGIRKWGEYPTLWGHETTGEVVQLGSGVSNVQEGDGVLSRITHGGFAEYCTAKAAHLVRLPENVGFEEGAIGQLLPIAVNAVQKSVWADDSVFVCGAGPAGQLVAQLAKAKEAGCVIVSDLYQTRLDLAVSLGADHALKADELNVGAEVQNITEGGADVSVECVGVEEAFHTCEAATRPGGKIAVFGTHLKPVTLDLFLWEGESFSLVIAREQANETPHLMQESARLLASGLVQLRPLLSHTFPLEQAGEAFRLLAEEPEKVMKIALVP